jgi:hypothetical protein
MAKKLRPLEPRNLALVADLELEGACASKDFFTSAGKSSASMIRPH